MHLEYQFLRLIYECFVYQLALLVFFRQLLKLHPHTVEDSVAKNYKGKNWKQMK